MTLSARWQRRRWQTSTGLCPGLACPVARIRRVNTCRSIRPGTTRKPGSLSINRDSGAWSDFATDDRGGDLVALAAYVLDCRQIEAAERLADHFGIAKPDRQQSRAKRRTRSRQGEGIAPARESAPRPAGRRRAVRYAGPGRCAGPAGCPFPTRQAGGALGIHGRGGGAVLLP